MTDHELFQAIKKRFGKQKAISCWMALNNITTSDIKEKAGLESTQAVRMYLTGVTKASKAIDTAASSLFGFEV